MAYGGYPPVRAFLEATMKEVSDVFSRLGAALEDGTLDQAEDAQLEAEIDEAVEKLLALKMQARAVTERGGR